MVKSKEIVIFIIFIVIAAFVLGSGMGNILVGNINLLDEGQFVAWPYQMLQGKLMFKDLFVMYGPLYVYPLYLASEIFGPTFFAIRIVFLLEVILGIITVYFICIKLNFKRITRVLIPLFLLLLPAMQIRHAVALVSYLFLLIANERKNVSWALFSGVFSSAAFLTSPEIGIFWAISAGIFILINIRQWVKNGKLAAFITGNILILATFELLAFFEGWLTSYVRETVFVIQSFSGPNAAVGQNFPNLLGMISSDLSPVQIVKLIFSPEAMLYWAILFLILGFIHFASRLMIRKFSKQDYYILPMYFMSLFSFLSVVGRSSINHLYFVVPFSLIVGGYLVELLISEFKPWNKNINQKIVPALAIFVIVLIPVRLVTINRVNIANNLITLSNYNNYVPISNRDPLRVSITQKKYFENVKSIVKDTNSKDVIFVLQDEPGLYVIADRVNATKYDLPYFANQKELRAKVVSDLARKKPKVIIWNPKAWAVDNLSNDVRLPEVVRFINTNYNKHLVGGLIVYRVKNGKK